MDERGFNGNILIFFVLGASFIASLIAPTCSTTKSNKVSLKGQHEVELDLGFYDLNPSDGFLTYELFFERENIEKPLHTAIEHSTVVEYYDFDNDKQIRKFDGSIYPVIPNRQSVVTGSYRLFNDQSVHYTNNYIKVRIPNLPDNIKSITIVGKHGNAKYNAFQLYIRVIFSILSLVEFAIMLKKSQKEKSYVIYFSLLFFAVNPFMIVHYFYPTQIIVYFDCLSQALFASYSRFFFLSLLSSLRGSFNSQLPIVFFFIIYLLTKIFHNLSFPLANVGLFTAVSTQSMLILSFELGLEMTFLTWAIVSIFSSYSKSKTPIEKHFVKQFYFIFLVLCSIYFIKKLLNNLLLSGELINSEFLNLVLYYAVSYLIGAIGIRNSSNSKFTKLLYNNNDDVKEEPISAVSFEKTNDQV